jgi:membrane protease YdiL (CAAX protease family)
MLARTLGRMKRLPPTTSAPPAPAPRRTLAEEVLVVLLLSLLASAAYAVLSLFEAPLKGATVAAVSQDPRVVEQFLGVLFGLAPVYLVLHLVGRSGEGPEGIGLAWDDPGRDLRAGAALFVVVGLAGSVIYLAAVGLGINRFVIPAPPAGYWWTLPILLLRAAEAALLEEVIVLGYLVTRLEQLGATSRAAIGASALLRGAYHLYQGWGGFFGNLAMGVFFGALFVRRRRTWPFVLAHFLLDAGAAAVYLAFRDHLPGFS